MVKKIVKNTELAVKESTLPEAIESSPAAMIRMAVQGGADLEKLQGLLDIQLKWEANEARKAYSANMVLVQKEMPSIGKALKNEQTHSKYAALDEIICQAKDVYTLHGFSISFYEGTTDKPEHIRVCADVIHSMGHKETYFYDVPMDGKGIRGNANMTMIHGKASSTSYGRRYLMCMIWNIPTGDDDDGNAGGANRAGQPAYKKDDMDMPKTVPQRQKQVPTVEERDPGQDDEIPITEEPTIVLSDAAQGILNGFEIIGGKQALKDFAIQMKPNIDKLSEAEKEYLRDQFISIGERLK